MANILTKGIFKNAWFSENQIYSLQIAYGVHNLTSRHDSLNLKGSAESGEKNDSLTQFSLL